MLLIDPYWCTFFKIRNVYANCGSLCLMCLFLDTFVLDCILFVQHKNIYMYTCKFINPTVCIFIYCGICFWCHKVIYSIVVWKALFTLVYLNRFVICKSHSSFIVMGFTVI
jgi:hypothetical protein